MTFKIVIDGVISTNKTAFIGINRFTSITKIKDTCQEDLAILLAITNKQNISITGHRMIIYKYIDQHNESALYLNAVPAVYTNSMTDDFIKNNVIVGTIPSYSKVLKATLQGNYENINQLWELAFQHIKDNKLIYDAYASPWESYVVGHNSTDNQDNFITEVYIPLV